MAPIKELRIAILCGSYREYVYFCKEQNYPLDGNVMVVRGERIRTVYCDTIERMCGWMPDVFIRTGTWQRQPQEIIERFDFFKKDTESRRHNDYNKAG
jgi:hypothetical protein